MLRAMVVSMALLVCASGCADPPHLVPAAPPRLAPPVMAPSRPLPRSSQGGQSLLLKPSMVEDLVVDGSGTDVRVLLGAVFGSGMHEGRPTIGLALVLQAFSAAEEPALAASRTMEVLADGEVVVRRTIELGQLYHRESGLETLIIPIEPAYLGDIVGADRVEMQLGSSVAFRLGEQNLRDFEQLMSRITEDVNQVRRAFVEEHPLRKGM